LPFLLASSRRIALLVVGKSNAEAVSDEELKALIDHRIVPQLVRYF
jgi:hypothetical protein